MDKLDILSCHCQLVGVGARFCRRYFDDMCRALLDYSYLNKWCVQSKFDYTY